MKRPPLHIGRPLAFETPQELLGWFLDYLDDCITDNKLANMAGFRANKMIPRTTLNDYEKKPAFSSVFVMMYDILEDAAINNKTVDPSTKKLVLQSKFGYSDKILTENVNHNIENDKDVLAQLKQKLSDRK